MRYEPITEDEMKMLVAFIEDDNSDVLGTDVPTKLSGLFYAFQKKMSGVNAELRKENARLRRRLSGLENKREAEIRDGVFGDLNLDSVDVARAVLYICSQKGYAVTVSKLMAMVYDVYALWLVSQRQRLFLEHPVAQESGPWFWRIAKNVNVRNGWNGKDAFEAVALVNSGVAAIIKRVACKYGDIAESSLCDWIRKTAPYKESHKDRNQGKWNKEISDRSIYVWKSEEMGR